MMDNIKGQCQMQKHLSGIPWEVFSFMRLIIKDVYKWLKINGGGKWKEVENRGKPWNITNSPGEMVKKPENPGTGLSAMPRGGGSLFFLNFPAI